MRGSNFEVVAEKLSSSFKEVVEKEELIKQIQTQLDKIDKVLSNLNNLNNNIETLNLMQKRKKIYENLLKERGSLDLSDEPFQAMVDKEVGFLNYKEKKYFQDVREIEKWERKLDKYSKQGYSIVMKMRELMTGQKIMYAIEQIQNSKITGESVYHYYLDEKEFFKLFNIESSSWAYGGNKEDFKSISAYVNKVDTKAILKISGTEIKETRDWVYKYLAHISESNPQIAKNEVLENKANRFEVYTELKSHFRGKEKPKDDILMSYLLNFLETKHIWIKTITSAGNVSEGQSQTNQIDRLTYYQGGDSTYSNRILIQNKSSGAIVRIGTTYNALKKIKVLFKGFPNNLDVQKIKILFTAVFQESPADIVVNKAFENANKYAQEHIEDVIKIINK